MDKVRSRSWCLVLYPDDDSHCACVDFLRKSGYAYALIKHDRDTYLEGESEDHKAGELKKAHWHIVLRLQNPRWREAVAAELGIKPNYLEPCRNRDSALLYMIHDGYPDRFQYDVSDVSGPLALNLAKLLVDDDEGQRVKTIIQLIDDTPGMVSYRDILLKACDSGLYGEFRRLGSGVKWLIEEHNAVFTVFL